MLKLKFGNNVEQVYESALETEEYYNGSSRRTLTFEINPEDCNLQELSDLCTEENCELLTLTNDEENITNFFENYVLKLQVGIESKLIDSEQNIYVDKVILKLGKRTYIEQKLHELGIN